VRLVALQSVPLGQLSGAAATIARKRETTMSDAARDVVVTVLDHPDDPPKS
jgi:hypothetical protein